MKHKIKVIVAIVLFLSVFLAGTVITLGHVKNYLLPAYFFFMLGLLGVVVFSARNFFENKKDLVFALIATLMIAGFSVYSIDGARVYMGTQQSLGQGKNLALELDSLSKSIENDANYINYIQGEISRTQGNSIKLLNDINTVTASRNTTMIINKIVYRDPPTRDSPIKSLSLSTTPSTVNPDPNPEPAPVITPPASPQNDDGDREREGGEYDD